MLDYIILSIFGNYPSEIFKASFKEYTLNSNGGFINQDPPTKYYFVDVLVANTPKYSIIPMCGN